MFYVLTEERKKRRAATADAHRVEAVMNVLRGNWDDLPPDAPTCVRFYLCAQEDGEWERGGGRSREEGKRW